MKKRRVSKPLKSAIFTLTQGLWYHLICPVLSESLEDLIALKRTCRYFANNEKLLTFISKREEATFGSTIQQPWWNKFVNVIDRVSVLPPNCIVFCEITKGKLVSIKFGAFTRPDLVWDSFLALELDPKSVRSASEYNDESVEVNCRINSYETVITLKGVSDQIRAWLLLKNEETKGRPISTPMWFGSIPVV